MNESPHRQKVIWAAILCVIVLFAGVSWWMSQLQEQSNIVSESGLQIQESGNTSKLVEDGAIREYDQNGDYIERQRIGNNVESDQKNTEVPGVFRGTENNDQELEQPRSNTPLDGCVITGCSQHICSNEEQISTCEWQDEYACYKQATCARTSDGLCGWQETPESKACKELVEE